MRFLRRKPRNVQQLPGDVPKEVEEYYESTRKERTGVAWLLGLATILLIVFIAIALFFGGRWAYRSAVDNWFSDETTSEPTEQEEAQQPDEEIATDEEPDGPPFVPDEQIGTPETQPDSREETPSQRRDATSIPRTGPTDE